MGLDIWRNPRTGRNLFEEIDREFAEAEHMLNGMFRIVPDIVPTGINSGGFPYYYGYQITIGPDGRPKINEFGNVKLGSKDFVEQNGVREPLVDNVLNKKQNTLTITAEMPGVDKENINVNVTGHHVTFHAEKGDRKYHADIPIDINLEESTTKAVFLNGILELRIKLKENSRTKGKAIKIE
ncbi:MAG TPA: archaeal heat shock protein Hsp20 [Candidatus Bathyarchaeia archaeon]|nr:archaeal heat shock protein Hsp20 [Candidatus Bathyarchaeia archaeon]